MVAHGAEFAEAKAAHESLVDISASLEAVAIKIQAALEYTKVRLDKGKHKAK